MAKKKRSSKWVQAVSFVLHGAAFAAVAAISTGHVPAPIAVMVADVVQPEETPPPPPPPQAVPEEAPRERRARSQTPEAPSQQQAQSNSDSNQNAAPDYGIALDGVANGVGGIGVPIGDPGGQRRDSNTRPAAPRVLEAVTNEPRQGRGCREDEVPPRQRRLRVNYTDDAVAARIEGRVRISVQLDEEGRVTDASILTPLGHGLDESALASVRSASFDPATRCGRPVATSFVIGVRFQL